jgi:aryl-alcohol dehydrogenase-like predicted oxidoreductase
LPVCRELGIGFVPYSPLGRGFLTGQITSRADLSDKDWRHNDPRYSEENFDANLKLVEIVPACRELGIGLVPYSPLGRGFLTGAIRSLDDLAEDDWRRANPRFQGENFERNLSLVAHIERLAADKGCTPAQLALAWVLAQGGDVAPIPGTRSRTRLDENAAATTVALSAGELAAIGELIPTDMAAGTRYPASGMALING